MKNNTAINESIQPNSELLYALATNALSSETALSDACETDMHRPEDEDRVALEWNPEMDKRLLPSVIFGIALRFGIHIGARLALNPLGEPDLHKLIKEFKDELSQEFMQSYRESRDAA